MSLGKAHTPEYGYGIRTCTHVRVLERNVNGFEFQIEYGNGTETGCLQKLGTGTKRLRIFSKRWCINGGGTEVFQKLSKGTGF